MLPLVRIALLLLLAVAFVAVAFSVFVEDTGVVEKAALVAVAVLVLLAMSRVRRLGPPTTRH